MEVSTPLADEISRYLDLSTDRMQLISSNMANVDTPGYRTQDIDFEGEFARAQSQVMAERMGVEEPPSTAAGAPGGRPARAAGWQQCLARPRKHGPSRSSVSNSAPRPHC